MDETPTPGAAHPEGPTGDATEADVVGATPQAVPSSPADTDQPSPVSAGERPALDADQVMIGYGRPNTVNQHVVKAGAVSRRFEVGGEPSAHYSYQSVCGEFCIPPLRWKPLEAYSICPSCRAREPGAWKKKDKDDQ